MREPLSGPAVLAQSKSTFCDSGGSKHAPNTCGGSVWRRVCVFRRQRRRRIRVMVGRYGEGHTRCQLARGAGGSGEQPCSRGICESWDLLSGQAIWNAYGYNGDGRTLSTAG